MPDFDTITVAESDARLLGYNYHCRRCDVQGRTPPGKNRSCWSCQRGDQLEQR